MKGVVGIEASEGQVGGKGVERVERVEKEGRRKEEETGSEEVKEERGGLKGEGS